MGMQLCLMKPSLIARHVEHQPPLDCVTALGVSSLCTHSENLKRQTCGESRPFAFLLVVFKSQETLENQRAHWPVKFYPLFDFCLSS